MKIRQHLDVAISLSVKRPLFLHPFIIFSAVWLSVSFLYSLHLSSLLRYTTREAFTTALLIWAPFVAVLFICGALHVVTTLGYSPAKPKWKLDCELLERRLRVWFKIWLAISVIEIIVSGGIPLLWALQGSSKTYVDFGIPSLHGLVNSLLVAVALCQFFLFLVTKKRRHLVLPVFVLVWSVLVITRQLMLSSLLEFCVVFLRLRPVRARTIVAVPAVLLLFILLFGVIGDVRQGSSDAFRTLAQPTSAYPDWLPSGLLWGYIYITTPINNLMFTMQTVAPANNVLFPNTSSTLFPSVLRTMIYGSALGDAESGQLVTDAFNVSTAYVGPYQDYGLLGMALFSGLVAFMCYFLWIRSDIKHILMYAVVAQCLILTLFFNLFFALPVIAQLIWLSYFFMPAIRFGVRMPDTLITTPERARLS
jgi:oligosaccharide repeat unit polymerase